MLIVPLEEVQVGMVLAAPVMHPEHPDQDLLKRGYIMEAPVLRRLHELEIPEIFVEYPGLEDLDRHLGATLSPARQMIYSQIRETIRANEKHARPAVSYSDYYKGTREMVMTLLSQGSHPIYLDAMQRLGSDAIGHATAVAHLSLLMGLKLESYLIAERSRLPAHHAKDVINLGVAGMLHDMGKLKLANELKSRHVANLPDDKLMGDWQEHSRLGYDAIREGVQPTAASAVLHHHQRFDGKGFPKLVRKGRTTLMLEGRGIHIFPRIIAVADLYDRLSVPMQKGKGRRTNTEILRLLQKEYASWCDPTILSIVAVVCPPFPPGCRVKLSDGTLAVAVDITPGNPYLPIVRRYNADGKTLDPTKVNLAKAGLKVIAMGDQPINPDALPVIQTPADIAADTTPSTAPSAEEPTETSLAEEAAMAASKAA